MSSIPGFRAEASLDKSELRFVGETSKAGSNVGEVVAHAVTAQFITHRPPVDCDFMECHRSGGHLICWCG
jgi:hypothetical protein